MFEQPIQESRTKWRIAASIAAHVVVLLALFRFGHSVAIRAVLPGTRTGTRIELSYLPGRTSPAAPRSTRKQAPALAIKESKLSLPPLPAPAPAMPAQSATSSSAQSSATSNDAMGTEDMRIALTTYSPSPRPDLSRLPHGAQGDVVVDLTIDPGGEVADLRVTQSLGYGVDDEVAQIVRTWKFSPATRNGVPVASEQELHFHYGPV